MGVGFEVRVTSSHTQTRSNKEFVVFDLEVKYNGESWIVGRRYSELFAFYNSIKTKLSEDVVFPTKKNLQPFDVHSEQLLKAIENFFVPVVANHKVISSPEFRVFLRVGEKFHSSSNEGSEAGGSIPSSEQGEAVEEIEDEGTGESYIALEDSQPDGEDMLAYKEGEKVIVIFKDESGWWQGINEAGAVGWLAPDTLRSEEDGIVEEEESGDGVIATVICAYTADDDVKLSLLEGTTVTILEQNDSGWWKADCDGEVGWIPSDFVEIIENGSKDDNDVQDADEAVEDTPAAASAQDESADQGGGSYLCLGEYSDAETGFIAFENDVFHHYAGAEDEQRLHGECNGVEGYIPRDKVRVLEEHEKEKITEEMRGLALSDFEATDESQLAFHEGDVIFILETHDSGWWSGEFSGKNGWFPSDFVETYNQEVFYAGEGEDGSAIPDQDEVPAEEKEESVAETEEFIEEGVVDEDGGGLQDGGEAEAEAEGSGEASVEVEAEPEAEAEGAGAGPEGEEALVGEDGKILCGVALADFDNGNDISKLSFVLGDVIVVLELDESGWWHGDLNGTQGWFPKDFVEETWLTQDEIDEVMNAEVEEYEDLGDVQAMCNFEGDTTWRSGKLLLLVEGMVVKVVEKSNVGWWKGISSLDDSVGWFPKNRVDDEIDEIDQEVVRKRMEDMVATLPELPPDVVEEDVQSKKEVEDDDEVMRWAAMEADKERKKAVPKPPKPNIQEQLDRVKEERERRNQEISESRGEFKDEEEQEEAAAANVADGDLDENVPAEEEYYEEEYYEQQEYYGEEEAVEKDEAAEVDAEAEAEAERLAVEEKEAAEAAEAAAEAERLAAEEEEARLKAEEEAKAAEEAAAEAEEARLKAEEEAAAAVEAEAAAEAERLAAEEEEARLKAEEEAAAAAEEEEARLKAEEEAAADAERKAAEEAKAEEEEARLKAEEEAKAAAEAAAEAERLAAEEEEARLKAEEEAKAAAEAAAAAAATKRTKKATPKAAASKAAPKKASKAAPKAAPKAASKATAKKKKVKRKRLDSVAKAKRKTVHVDGNEKLISESSPHSQSTPSTPTAATPESRWSGEVDEKTAHIPSAGSPAAGTPSAGSPPPEKKLVRRKTVVRRPAEGAAADQPKKIVVVKKVAKKAPADAAATPTTPKSSASKIASTKPSKKAPAEAEKAAAAPQGQQKKVLTKKVLVKKVLVKKVLVKKVLVKKKAAEPQAKAQAKVAAVREKERTVVVKKVKKKVATKPDNPPPQPNVKIMPKKKLVKKVVKKRPAEAAPAPAVAKKAAAKAPATKKTQAEAPKKVKKSTVVKKRVEKPPPPKNAPKSAPPKMKESPRTKKQVAKVKKVVAKKKVKTVSKSSASAPVDRPKTKSKVKTTAGAPAAQQKTPGATGTPAPARSAQTKKKLVKKGSPAPKNPPGGAQKKSPPPKKVKKISSKAPQSAPPKKAPASHAKKSSAPPTSATPQRPPKAQPKTKKVAQPRHAAATGTAGAPPKKRSSSQESNRSKVPPTKVKKKKSVAKKKESKGMPKRPPPKPM